LKQLEEEKNGYSERLISLKVNMDDWKSISKEVEDNI
jgi:hypothetical protein